eukprot:6212710-Pleurochrysis_carterae.AAC.2
MHPSTHRVTHAWQCQLRVSATSIASRPSAATRPPPSAACVRAARVQRRARRLLRHAAHANRLGASA